MLKYAIIKKIHTISHLRLKLILTAVFAMTVVAFYAWGIPCVYSAVFSVPCPGCGMTRAWRCALSLDLIGAWNYHPMFWSVPLIYLYILFDGKLFQRRWLDRMILSFLAFGFLLAYSVRLFGLFG